MQLNYDVNFEAAFEGLLGDVNNIDSVSRLVEGAGLLFGRGARSGTSENQAIVAAAGMTLPQFEGFVIHQSVEKGELVATYPISVLRKGRIWVKADTVMLKDGLVFLVLAGGEIGAVRATDGGSDLDVSSKCKVVKGAAAIGDLALIEINI